MLKFLQSRDRTQALGVKNRGLTYGLKLDNNKTLLESINSQSHHGQPISNGALDCLNDSNFALTLMITTAQIVETVLLRPTLIPTITFGWNFLQCLDIVVVKVFCSLCIVIVLYAILHKVALREHRQYKKHMGPRSSLGPLIWIAFHEFSTGAYFWFLKCKTNERVDGTLIHCRLAFQQAMVGWVADSTWTIS